MYLVRRFFWAIVLFLTITLFTFVIFYVIPSQDVKIGRFGISETIKTQDVNEASGLHGSVFAQYGQYLGRMVSHGSLGRSITNRQEVTAIVWRALPVTASLVFGGMVLWLLIAIPVGILSAVRPRSLFDRGGMIFVLVGISAHPAWLGLILAYFLGFRWQVMPLSGYCQIIHVPSSATCGGPTQWAYHLILPWVAFAMLFAAMYARMVRASVIESLDEDYVRTARAKGASELRVIFRHVFRNAMLPIVSMLGVDAGMAFGGGLIANAIWMERVFGLPGMGGALISAVPVRDITVIVGITMVVAVFIIVSNLIADVAYALVDPRIRISTTQVARPARWAREERVPAAAPAATSASSS